LLYLHLLPRTPAPTLFPYTTLFRSRDDLDAFLVQAGGKRKRVVAADRNQIVKAQPIQVLDDLGCEIVLVLVIGSAKPLGHICLRSEEHTSELQSRFDLVCRLLLEKK